MRSVGHSIKKASTADRSVIFIHGQVICNRGVSSCRGVGSMNSSSSSSSWDVLSHPAMPVIIQVCHLVVEMDPWILRLLPLPLFVALWCPSTSRVENMHPSITSISISMMFTLSSSFHSSVWIPSYLHLSSSAPASQHDRCITAGGVTILPLPLVLWMPSSSFLHISQPASMIFFFFRV